MGRRLGKDVALITDGRFFGGSHGFVVGHITPEAYVGGPLWQLSRMVTASPFDAEKRTLNLDLPQSEITKRLKECGPRQNRATPGSAREIARNW